MASSQAFEEIPSKDELETIWRSASVRYRVLRRVMGSTIATFADGSAHQHRNLAIVGRGLGEPALGFPRPTFSEPEVQLFTDGACFGDHGPGGWAYLLIRPEGGGRKICADGVPRATNNQMELTAVIRGLQAIEEPSRVMLFTDGLVSLAMEQDTGIAHNGCICTACRAVSARSDSYRAGCAGRPQSGAGCGTRRICDRVHKTQSIAGCWSLRTLALENHTSPRLLPTTRPSNRTTSIRH